MLEQFAGMILILFMAATTGAAAGAGFNPRLRALADHNVGQYLGAIFLLALFTSAMEALLIVSHHVPDGMDALSAMMVAAVGAAIFAKFVPPTKTKKG